jgi:subtilase family serine protease
VHRKIKYTQIVAFLFLITLLTACGASPAATVSAPTSTPTNTPTPVLTPITCPFSKLDPACLTPADLRRAYHIDPLLSQGYTGKGQTIVDIVALSSPTIQTDIASFDAQFGLPAAQVQVVTLPNHTTTFSKGWAEETTLDVETMHSYAPGAKIIVLQCGFASGAAQDNPDLLGALEYAVTNKLGSSISLSFGESEAIEQQYDGAQNDWDSMFHQATTQEGMSFFVSSGDTGATQYADLNGNYISTSREVSFPSDDPWVTSVGGTTLARNGNYYIEGAWDLSGGGVSKFYSEPTYQQKLSSSVQNILQGQRGMPDVAGNAFSILAIYYNGKWATVGGTSASAPLWAALMAIANQMAGKHLGFINPTLYKLATTRYYEDFNDITYGNNTFTHAGTDYNTTVQGYSATAGWDPVTGLGSPKAANLLPDLVAALK